MNRVVILPMLAMVDVACVLESVRKLYERMN